MGAGSFMPSGMIATFAQAAGLGRRGAGGRGRRRKRRSSTRSTRSRAAKSASPKRRSGSRTKKPRPGTKAWMAYIRTKRRKK